MKKRGRPRQGVGTISSSVTVHSLMALTVFLKLPKYAEKLFEDWKAAECLLRLFVGGDSLAVFNASMELVRWNSEESWKH